MLLLICRLMHVAGWCEGNMWLDSRQIQSFNQFWYGVQVGDRTIVREVVNDQGELSDRPCQMQRWGPTDSAVQLCRCRLHGGCRIQPEEAPFLLNDGGDKLIVVVASSCSPANSMWAFRIPTSPRFSTWKSSWTPVDNSWVLLDPGIASWVVVWWLHGVEIPEATPPAKMHYTWRSEKEEQYRSPPWEWKSE